MKNIRREPLKIDTLIEMTIEEMVIERKNAKLIATEDVMRSVRLLAGWGLYPQFLAEPGNVFDKYDEMSIEELHGEAERLECLASQYVQGLHPRTINRVLRDNEQDYEDNN